MEKLSSTQFETKKLNQKNVSVNEVSLQEKELK